MIPLQTELRDNASGIALMPIEKANVREFAQLVRREVSCYYPETEEFYPFRLAEIAFLGIDPFGLFTLRRMVWSVKAGNNLAGFLVMTEKRGGSVKLGPMVMVKRFRKRGIGSSALRVLFSHYGRLGFRKVYATIPATNVAVTRLLETSGFVREATLKQHYSTLHNEVVFGTFIGTLSSRATRDPRISVHPSRNIDPRLHEFVLSEFGADYDELDETFTSNLLSANDRSPLWDYNQKPRKLFWLHPDQNRAALVVAAPKRGGAVKLGPVGGAVDLVSSLIEQTENFFFESGRRKLYALVPTSKVELISLLLGLGYEKEGTLREPYRPGVDNAVLSKVKG